LHLFIILSLNGRDCNFRDIPIVTLIKKAEDLRSTDPIAECGLLVPNPTAAPQDPSAPFFAIAPRKAALLLVL